MNRDCKKYLKEVHMLIPLNGRLERKFLHNMRENLEDFYSENKNAIYSDICHHFGTPKEFVIEYFENTDIEYLIKRLSIITTIRRCIIGVMLAVLLTCAAESFLYCKAYQEAVDHIDGYWIETIK